MKNSLRYFFLFFIALLLVSVTSCERRPKNVLSKGKMEDVLYDYHLARSMAENLPPDQMYKQRYFVQGVFDKYGISEADFDSSMVWYCRHTEDMSDIYKKVQDRLKSNINKMNKLITESQRNPVGAASGDSLNIWTFAKNTRLTGDDMHNKIVFSISPDSTFHPRDAFEWNVNFISTGMMNGGATMSLSICYQNDSTVTQIAQLMGAGNRSLRVQNNLPIPIRKINGFIYVPKGIQGAIVIQTKALKRYHAHGNAPMPSAPNNNMPGNMPNGQSMPPNGQMKQPNGQPIPQAAPGNIGQHIPGSAGGKVPNAAKVDTAKAIIQGVHRLTPQELNKKRTDSPTPHGYQLRQEALEKQMQQNKSKYPVPIKKTK